MRTVIQAAIAAIIVWITANGVDGLHNLSWWQAVAMAGLSGAAAAVMRIFAPIVTDFRDRYVDAPKTAGTTGGTSGARPDPLL